MMSFQLSINVRIIFLPESVSASPPLIPTTAINMLIDMYQFSDIKNQIDDIFITTPNN